jgi:hypothetical protein
MTALARELWRAIEPFHQLVYRSPEATFHYGKIGLIRPELQYFGNRLAALGNIGPTHAVSVLWGFAPAYVARAVPEVWSIADARVVAEARLHAADATLRRILGDQIDSPEMTRCAADVRRMVEGLDFAGASMAAAHFDLDYPDEPALALWHSCTVLREHRGDAHWRATGSAGIDSVECHILHAADGAMPADLLQRVSGWDDAAWADATERLRSRGLLGKEHLVLTAEGRATKLNIERTTDRAAGSAIEVIGSDRSRIVRETMRPWTNLIMDSGVIGAWKMREELWKEFPD